MTALDRIKEKIKLGIEPIGGLLAMNLKLPEYQRPYRWSVISTNTLLNDIYRAYIDGIEEYRLGSVILHRDGDKFNIVDGQQRLTTLTLLLHLLGETKLPLLDENYSVLSNASLVTNYRILEKRIKDLFEGDENERTKYKDYVLNKCTAVMISTNSEQEAFQFFDSQNSRGKELAPHDLLKSFHLREMRNEDEAQKIKIINQWEKINQSELDSLFRHYLYPMTQWYKVKDGIGYSASRIDTFKGIKAGSANNYALYHKASHLFVEQFNASGNSDLLASGALNQFQLTQPIIAGRRFFGYSLHYGVVLEKVRKKISDFYSDDAVPSRRAGDIYVKQLYECALLFFVDRFGLECLSKSVMRKLYEWSYYLRIAMNAVYTQTVNKYAKGLHDADRGLSPIAMFTKISEMREPDEILMIDFQLPSIASNANQHILTELGRGENNG
jgi:hypothetical protein